MPVLPEVGSTSTLLPGLMMPFFSMDSSMLTPMRSFTEAIGLKNSSLASRLACTPCFFASLSRRTIGVSPMVSVMSLKIRPRPGVFAMGLLLDNLVRNRPRLAAGFQKPIPPERLSGEDFFYRDAIGREGLAPPVFQPRATIQPAAPVMATAAERLSRRNAAGSVKNSRAFEASAI